MDSTDDARTPISVIAIKVLVGLAPSFLLQQVFVLHPKLAYGVGLVIGAVAWYFVPPRGKAWKLLVLIGCAVVFGLIRSLFP